MKNLIKDKSGVANVIILAIFTVIMGFAMLTIGSYLYYAIAGSADAGTQTIFPGSAATDTMTFAGMVRNYPNNETINLSTETYSFVNGTNMTTTAAFDVNISDPNNATSPFALSNASWSCEKFVTEVNANSTLFSASTCTAANVTTITSLSVGTAGNSLTATTNVTAGTLGATTFAGGVDSVTGQASQNSLNNYVATTFPLFGLALMILGFGVIYITLRKSFGGGGEVR